MKTNSHLQQNDRKHRHIHHILWQKNYSHFLTIKQLNQGILELTLIIVHSSHIPMPCHYQVLYCLCQQQRIFTLRKLGSATNQCEQRPVYCEN